MYVQPNTNIKIIKNCPLDPTQDHTIYFTSVNQQTAFFIHTLDGYLIPSNSYQRVDKNKMRIARNAESLYNCNYLAFQNASFGSKWFYAFITSIEYINNVTSEITYKIDVMQTWHFNYVLMDCFVEREHSLTDEIGDNIIPEKIDTGDYIVGSFSKPTQLDDLSIVLFATVDRNYNNVGGDYRNNLFSGLYPVDFPLTPTGATQALSWINNLPVIKTNAVVCACIMPTINVSAWIEQTFTVNKVTSLMRSDGTQVKNKKCLIYPYNFLYITNNQGKSATYRYEFFNGTNCQFSLWGDCTPNPSAIMIPKNYKYYQNQSGYENEDESISLTGYPQIAYNIDSFKAWLAQSASSIGISAMACAIGANIGESTFPTSTALVNLGATPYLGEPTPASMSIPFLPLFALASQAVSGVAHAFMPPQSKGSQTGAGLLAAGMLNFGVYNKHISPEFATVIDDYFSRFGYATNKLKRPNRNVRKEWTYVKTIGCCIDGAIDNGLPASAMAEICKIYDNGITFWNNPAHIGDYTLDNSPIIGGE